MDTDAVHPASLKAAFRVGIETLERRSEVEGLALDWNTIEIALWSPERAGSDCSMLIVRAGVLS